MIVTHEIRIDLLCPGIESRIYAVQDDKYCRNLKIFLFAASMPWVIPEGTSVLVGYRKPDGTGGIYDTLPDGSVASSMTGNALTVALAPQVLTVAGPVSLTVTMVKGNQQLTTFSILVRVAPNTSANLKDSEKYFNVTGFLPAPKSAKPGQYFRVLAVDENNKITDVEAVDAPDGSDPSKNVNPVPKTEDMTQLVGVDEEGRLWTSGNVEPGKYPDWSHLTWYVMGDSLTAPGHEHTKKYYYEFIQEKTGINIIVDGIGGTGYRAGYSDNENSFLGRVQRAFPENDKTKNSNVDIVTIFGSGNDIRFVSDSKERKNAIFNTLAHLANHRPGLRVIVVPPSPWMSERDSDHNIIVNYDKRKELWKPYCDDLQLCALVCDFRYLSDMYDCPPFNPNFNGHLQKFFGDRPDGKEADGIHPSTNGHKALAQYFYNALLQELSFRE